MLISPKGSNLFKQQSKNNNYYETTVLPSGIQVTVAKQKPEEPP